MAQCFSSTASQVPKCSSVRLGSEHLTRVMCRVCAVQASGPVPKLCWAMAVAVHLGRWDGTPHTRLKRSGMCSPF